MLPRVAHLVVIAGPHQGLVLRLHPGDLTLGRDPTADVVVPDDSISRHHCRLVCEPDGWRLVDLDSLNATYLNGAPVLDAVLDDGDELRMGQTALRFVASDGELVRAEGRSAPTLRVTEDALLRGAAPQPPRAGRLDHLLDLSERIIAAASVGEILERLAATLVEALSCPVTIYQLSGHRMRAVAARGGDGEPLSSVVVDGELLDQVRDERTTLWHAESRLVLSPVGHEPALHVAVIRCDGHAPDEADLRFVVCATRLVGGALATTRRLSSLQRVVDRAGLPVDDEVEIIADSPAMKPVIRFVDRAAASEATVLLRGETGTGKEVVARTIHTRSHRSAGPLVVVNCAGLPESLIESELFGYERGAFTGAQQSHAGRFERASGGTVFLDEIGELSLAAQARLLRVLEHRTVERLGGRRPIEVDVRVIAATHRDLRAMCGDGTFRDDLYYRLAVLCVELPPLRDRPEDIPILTRYWLALQRPAHAPPLAWTIGEDAAALLARYSWPGNIRQLRNVIEHAMAMCEGSSIGAEDLPAYLSSAERTGSGLRLPASLRDVERAAIAAALEEAGGNKTHAARRLGIERATLYHKIRLYGLDPAG
jgi:DNA-binding NtrC family response regulator